MNGVRYKTLAELKAVIEASSMVLNVLSRLSISLCMSISTATLGSEFISRGTRSFSARARGAIFYPRRGEGWYMRDDALAAVKWLERFAPAAKWREDGTPITKRSGELKTLASS